MRAGEQGLDPALFHTALLGSPAATAAAAALSPIDRELLLSDAVLGYADALARGALPIEDRMDDEDLTPGPLDVAAVIDQAIASRDPASVIAALAPQSPDYLALRHALAADGPGPAGDAAAEAQRRAIAINLERLRWLPRQLPADRVWVNTASARLVLYRANQPVFTTRVVVGESDKQTPEFQTTIDSVLFNPPWNIPPSIAEKEILPKLQDDPDYLAEHYMVWRRAGALQQVAGPHSALGRLKFEMNDRYDVYLHDTPERFLFSRADRRRSHGCVRVQQPRELAALLLDALAAEIDRNIAQDQTHRRMLPAPMPVFIVYQTAVAEPDGQIAVFPDVYDRDPEIWQRLHPIEPAPMAEHEPPGQRRG
jgi:murein L,D-transpeptidase YcbB/YkuD